jgi:hypothetical protein
MATCPHGVNLNEEDCNFCDLRDAQGCADGEMLTCRHGTYIEQVECEDCAEDDCGDIPGTGEDDEDDDMQRGAELDAMAERHRERQDFAYFHPED